MFITTPFKQRVIMLFLSEALLQLTILESNDIDSSRKAVQLNNNKGSLFKSNDVNDTTSNGHEYLVQNNSTLKFEKTFFPSWRPIISDITWLTCRIQEGLL